MTRLVLVRAAVAGAALTLAGGLTAASGGLSSSPVAASGSAGSAAAAHRSNDHGAARSAEAKAAAAKTATTTQATAPELLPCTSEFENHGQYVRQNSSAVVSLGKLGRVESHGRPENPNMVGELVRQAAHSDCGKTDRTTSTTESTESTESTETKTKTTGKDNAATRGNGKAKGHTKTR